MKRKDIEALLEKDPETVFFVDNGRYDRPMPVLVAGIKEASVQGFGWREVKRPARVITRSLNLGSAAKFFAFGQDPLTPEQVAERGVEQRDGYWLGPPNDRGYRAGEPFNKISGPYEGTLAEYIAERLDAATEAARLERAREEAERQGREAGASLKRAIEGTLGLEVGVEGDKYGKVILTLNAANARLVADAIGVPV